MRWRQKVLFGDGHHDDFDDHAKCNIGHGDHLGSVSLGLGMRWNDLEGVLDDGFVIHDPAMSHFAGHGDKAPRLLS